MPFLPIYAPPAIVSPAKPTPAPAPAASIPQRPTLAPWVEALTAHATDPQNAQDWEPGFGGLPLLRNPTFGPSSGMIVSLATGNETYLPEPDRIVKNGQGSDALFSRSYRSELARKGYGSPGLSPGWIHNFDLAMVGTVGRWGPIRLVYPNGAIDRFDPELSSTGLPTGKFTSSSGIAVVVTGVASGTTGDWRKITLRWKDDSLWVFEPQALTLGGKLPANAFTRLADDPEAKGGKLYLLTQLQNLRIDWDERRRVRAVRVDATVPSDPLLTFDYSPTTGLLAHLTDAERRRIDYGFKPRPSTAAKKVPGTTPSTGSKQPVLAFLSQLYLIGSKPTGLNHVGYDYVAGLESGAPLLSTVRVPHPGMPPGSLAVVSASIRYEKERVAAHEDANGVVHRFTYKPTGTQMDIQDGTGNTLTSLAFTIDTLGRLRAIKDVQGGTKSFGYGDTDAENAAVRAGALSVTPATTVPAPVPPVTRILPAAPARPTVPGRYTFTLIAQVETPDMPWMSWNAARSGAKPSPAGTPAPAPGSLAAIIGYRLNNAGLVAILGNTTRGANNTDGGGSVRVILTSDGKRENRLVTVGTVGSGVPDSPSVGGITELDGDSAFGLEDDGSVVFGADHEKIRRGVFRVTPSRAVTPVAGQYSVAPIKITVFHGFRVNGAGDICFEGSLMTSDYDKSPDGPVPDAPPWTPPPGMGLDGLFVIHQGKLRNVSDEVRAVVPFGYLPGYYQMNESGAVVVLWNTSMVDTERIYLAGASGVRLVAKSDTTMSNVFPVALSSDGTVTFRARLRGGTTGTNVGGSDARGVTSTSGTALFQWRDGQTRKLPDEDPRRSVVIGPHGERLICGIRTIMENGVRQDQWCLFTGPDSVNDLLLGPGVSILGATMTGLQSWSGLNNKGQFVFLASLDNKKTVLVRADPAGMAPEPIIETLGGVPPSARKSIPTPTTPTVGKPKTRATERIKRGG